jgi:N-ethylmaleimide reductase
VVSRVAARVGPDRVGIRLSPFNTYNGMETDAAVEDVFERLVRELDTLGIGYLHLVDFSSFGLPPPTISLKKKLRSVFRKTLVLSGGYDRARAEEDLQRGDGDLVAFGRPFIANPRLVTRMQKGEPLATPDPATFYTPGSSGYLDYPV